MDRQRRLPGGLGPHRRARQVPVRRDPGGGRRRHGARRRHGRLPEDGVVGPHVDDAGPNGFDFQPGAFEIWAQPGGPWGRRTYGMYVDSISVSGERRRVGGDIVIGALRTRASVPRLADRRGRLLPRRRGARDPRPGRRHGRGRRDGPRPHHRQAVQGTAGVDGDREQRAHRAVGLGQAWFQRTDSGCRTTPPAGSTRSSAGRPAATPRRSSRSGLPPPRGSRSTR